jgi:hypothetical protein
MLNSKYSVDALYSCLVDLTPINSFDAFSVEVFQRYGKALEKILTIQTSQLKVAEAKWLMKTIFHILHSLGVKSFTIRDIIIQYL